MACNHERIKCTDNVFYCAVCGAKVEQPVKEEKTEKPKARVERRGKKKEGE